MFDMQSIGKRISEMRKKRNMTQTELADRLSISYQAVSNWERGNSMPDIEKLPELADIFECSVDELLGRKSPLIESAMKDSVGEYVKSHAVSVDELQDALPILKPEQVDSIVDTLRPERIQEMSKKLEGLGEEIDVRVQQEMEKLDWFREEHVDALLPFMQTEDVRDFAEVYAQIGQSIAGFLPFMAEKDVVSLAAKTRANGGTLAIYLPFLSNTHVAEFARLAVENGESVDLYLPFLDAESISSYAKAAMARGDSIAVYLPFLSREEVSKLAQAAWDAGESLSMYLPFLEQDEVKRFAIDAAEQGRPVESFLPFMNQQEVFTMAMERMRESMRRLRDRKGGHHEE